MKLLTLCMTQFGSFAKPTVFHFPAEPGLFFMRGVNRADPRLEANGAGKSTVWAALTWLFYDRTVKGLRAGDVATWGTTGTTEVSLAFELEGRHYTMTRTWRPNTWELHDHYEGITDSDWQEVVDLVKHPDNPVLAAARLSLAAWQQCIVLASSEAMFLDFKPEAKAQFMADVLGLEQWEARAAAASKRAQDQDRKVRDLEAGVARLEGRVRALADSGHGQQEVDDWERQRREDVNKLFAQFRDIEAKLEQVQKSADEARAALPDLQKRFDGASAAVAGWRKDADSYAAQHRVLQAQNAKHRQELNAAADTGNCPTCGQPWDRKHAAAEEELLRQAEHEEQEVARMLQKCEQTLRARVDELAPIHRELEARERDLQRDEADCRYYERELDRLAEQAERMQAERNPFAQAQAKHLHDLDVARDDLAAAERELDTAAARHKLLAMWAQEFKAIRLQQMEEALQQLEMEVAGRCVELGLVGWRLLFTLDKVSKKGTVSRGFTVTVLSPYNDKAVPWESWSGGETQRLRIAAQMGLADVVRARTGCALALEVWDEPTQGLSAQGITDLLDCLAARAQQEQRQIWVVDHHSLGYGGFDGVVTVAKEQAGSAIES